MEVMRAISDTAHYEHLIQGLQLVSSVVAFIHQLDGDDPKDSEQRGVTRWKEPGSLNDCVEQSPTITTTSTATTKHRLSRLYTLTCVKPKTCWVGHCNHDSALINAGGACF